MSVLLILADGSVYSWAHTICAPVKSREFFEACRGRAQGRVSSAGLRTPVRAEKLKFWFVISGHKNIRKSFGF